MDAETKQDLITIALLMKKARQQEEAKKAADEADRAEYEAAVKKWKAEDVARARESYMARLPPEERWKVDMMIFEEREPLGDPRKMKTENQSISIVMNNEKFARLRDVVARLMDLLAENGYTTFEDMIRYVAANKPKAYMQLKEVIRRAWNTNTADPLDEISFWRGKEIFKVIDAEMNESENMEEIMAVTQKDMAAREMV